MKIILPSIGIPVALAILSWLAYMLDRPDVGQIFLKATVGFAVLGVIASVIGALINRR